jgi:pyridoxine 5-phosphate synthase
MSVTSGDVALGVNIDHIATVRQVRRGRYPDPVLAALICEQAGADSITLHLREDRRHIQDRDVERLRECLQTHMNLELAATPAMVEIACRLRPADVCLVPERREELTTEGGLDLARTGPAVGAAIERLSAAGVRVSLFIDPVPAAIESAARLGAPVIELHTGAYAESEGALRAERLHELAAAARTASAAGLVVNAGHGLHYHNVLEVARIPEIVELNIGHAIVARALFSGLPEAVREMKRLLRSARG